MYSVRATDLVSAKNSHFFSIPLHTPHPDLHDERPLPRLVNPCILDISSPMRSRGLEDIRHNIVVVSLNTRWSRRSIDEAEL
jgi:hypothetical protein